MPQEEKKYPNYQSDDYSSAYRYVPYATNPAAMGATNYGDYGVSYERNGARENDYVREGNVNPAYMLPYRPKKVTKKEGYDEVSRKYRVRVKSGESAGMLKPIKFSKDAVAEIERVRGQFSEQGVIDVMESAAEAAVACGRSKVSVENVGVAINAVSRCRESMRGGGGQLRSDFERPPPSFTQKQQNLFNEKRREAAERKGRAYVPVAYGPPRMLLERLGSGAPSVRNASSQAGVVAKLIVEGGSDDKIRKRLETFVSTAKGASWRTQAILALQGLKAEQPRTAVLDERINKLQRSLTIIDQALLRFDLSRAGRLSNAQGRQAFEKQYIDRESAETERLYNEFLAERRVRGVEI